MNNQPLDVHTHLKKKRKEKDEFTIVITGLDEEMLIDLEKHLHRTHCDYVGFELPKSFISEDDIDEEWHIKNV